MPRNVRNFWLDASIDGRAADLSGGPQSRDGGFDLSIKQRADGTVTQALSVWGVVRHDGTLLLIVEDHNGNIIHRHETAR